MLECNSKGIAFGGKKQYNVFKLHFGSPFAHDDIIGVIPAASQLPLQFDTVWKGKYWPNSTCS